MELPIAQALHQGIVAHKKGKLEEAERVYQAILLSQPAHPDANHNLGVLAISVGKADVALPFFKTALEANPKVEQFWLSYIDALIKERQFDSATKVIEQAKMWSVGGEKLGALMEQLLTKDEKAVISDLNPPQELQNSLIELYQRGQYHDAEKLALSITQDFPKYQFAWKVLGVVLGATGRRSEAVDAYQTAIRLSPQDAEAFSHLGVTFTGLGRLEEAEGSYNKAIALNPRYAEAHFNMGSMLSDLGRLDEAEKSYNQAIALKADYAAAHYNLGNELKKMGRLDEAAASYNRAIASKPNFAKAHCSLANTLIDLERLEEAIASYLEAIRLKPDFAEAYVNLGLSLRYTRFKVSNRKLYPPLSHLLTIGNFIRPGYLAGCIVSLLKHDPLLKDLLIKKNNVKNLTDATSIIVNLDKLPLLHQLMRICPLPDLELEGFFVKMRRFLLVNLYGVKESPETVFFLSTLALQCFVNEYIYVERHDETQLLDKLEAEIVQAMKRSEQSEAIKILCIACYRPLHKFDWCHKLLIVDQLRDVKRRLIEEPLEEIIIGRDIGVSDLISDSVSRKVRDMYEENPFPRWVKPAVLPKTISISQMCYASNLRLHSQSIQTVVAPAILIAGCGTGQHSIETATRYSNCHVTAIDLSLASLAYAKRKTAELGLTNLEYLQADILRLAKLEQQFDIVEVSGVLHHMNEPMAGWRVLVDLLRPGGLMKIGLYSELARSDFVEIRKEIALSEIGTSEREIREFRQSLACSRDEKYKRLTSFQEFFSLSELRDLIFHVQEHRFTLPQIKNSLEELELKFCGFTNQEVIRRFRERYGKEADIYSLDLWN